MVKKESKELKIFSCKRDSDRGKEKRRGRDGETSKIGGKRKRRERGEKDLWLLKGEKGKEDKEEKKEGSKQEMEAKDREIKMKIGLNKGTKIILEEK